ncbi:MAG: hypothetical protein Tsb002_25350 [Wenzhouxiangellaceae bacterium]
MTVSNDQTNFETIDAYLRGELSPDDEAAFEIQLLEDPELQDEVEAAILLKKLLSETSTVPTQKKPRGRVTGKTLLNFAAAASFAWAAFATVLLINQSQEDNGAAIRTIELAPSRSAPSDSRRLYISDEMELLNLKIDLSGRAGTDQPSPLAYMVELTPLDDAQAKSYMRKFPDATAESIEWGIKTRDITASEYHFEVRGIYQGAEVSIIDQNFEIIKRE